MTDLATSILVPLTSVLALLGTASFMIIVALGCSRFNIIKLSVPKTSTVAKLSIGVVFGLLAIYGTLMGSKLESGTIVNVRELAPMIAGIVGGPIAGVLAGVIGGVHRYSMGGLTALPCSISTVSIGLVAGLVSSRIMGKSYLFKGAVLAFASESGAMALILVLAQPFDKAVSVVGQIAFPMIAANTIGLVIWLYLCNVFRKVHVN